MSQNQDWRHATHAARVIKELLETETGHAATKAAFTTAVTVVAAVPVLLLPVAAVTGLVWWLSKK